MKAPMDRKPLHERLTTSLEEGIRHLKGEITLKTTTLELPDPPPAVEPADLIALRRRRGMSRAVFARVLNVSPKTVQSWEQGARKPSQAALRLIQLLDREPASVLGVVGLSPPEAAPGRSTRKKKPV